MNGMRIELDNVSRRYQTGGTDVWAVRDVSFNVAPGEFVAVIGRSGSGKTTLLNLIAGLERPSGGTICLDGEEISTLPEKRLTELRRRRIGFVFQSFGLLPLLSALENVELALRIAGAGRRERGRRAHEVLDMMGLGRRLHHRPYELSGGEQQRVAIARAIANRPALILADEPTGELDSVTGLTIFRALGEIARSEGITILTSTHDRAVMELASRVEELADGRLLPQEQRSLLRYATTREGRGPALAGLHPLAASTAPASGPADSSDAPEPVLARPAASRHDRVEEATSEPAASAEPPERWSAPAAEKSALANATSQAAASAEPAATPVPRAGDAADPEISRWAPPERRGG